MQLEGAMMSGTAALGLLWASAGILAFAANVAACFTHLLQQQAAEHQIQQGGAALHAVSVGASGTVASTQSWFGVAVAVKYAYSTLIVTATSGCHQKRD
jgi:hypothetical protein